MSRTGPSAARVAGPLRRWSRRLRLAADLDAARDELAEAHAALSRQKAFTDALLETIEVGIVSCDAQGVFVVSNRAEREIFGLDRGLDGMVPEDLRHLIVAWDTEGRRLTPQTYPLMRALRGEDMSHVDVVVGPADGPQREIVVRASRIHAADGSVLGAVAALSDVTAERSAMRALDEERHKLAEAQAFAHAVLAASPDMTLVTDLATGEVVYASPGKDTLGFTPDAFTRLGPDGVAARVHDEDRHLVRDLTAAVRTVADGETVEARYRTTDAEGRTRWVNHCLTPFRRDDSGALVQVLAVVRDVTELVRAEAALTHAALHDSLTGLPNRAHLVATLGTALERTSSTGEEVAVLFVDLDGFKTVNDTGGHSAGDVVLQETARRLRRVLRPQDQVARVGGDEFVVVVQPRSRDDLEADAPDVRSCAVSLAARVAAVVGRPVTVGGLDHRVTASIGITYAGGGTDPSRHDDGVRAMTVDDVLHRADAAMYRAKERGKDRYEVLESAEVNGPVPA